MAVASAQAISLKTEVEEDFMRTVNGHELPGPKRLGKFLHVPRSWHRPIGKRVNILVGGGKYCMVTSVNVASEQLATEGVFYPF